MVQRPAGQITLYALGQKVDTAGTVAAPPRINPRLIATLDGSVTVDWSNV